MKIRSLWRFTLGTAVCGVWLGFSVSGRQVVSASEIPYRVRFRGVPERAMKQDFKAAADTVALRKRPPASLRQLQRRAHRDEDRFLQILHTLGYHDAVVQTRIREGRQPVRVTFVVDPGKIYSLRSISIVNTQPETTVSMPSGVAVGLRRGAPAHARPVVQAESEILRNLEGQGFPFPRVVQRDVRIEQAARAMDITYRVEPGPRALFGPFHFSGLQTVHESYVQKKIPWRTGDVFDGAALRLAQRGLINTDLFSTVRMVTGDSLQGDLLPVEVQVVERLHRSLILGGGYRSDEGARARVGWEHRNLFSAAERLSLNVHISEIGYEGLVRLQKPDWWRLDQKSTLTLRASREETEAYFSRNVSAVVEMERPLSRRINAGVGTGFRYADVEQDTSSDYFGLFYIPLFATWDGSDDLLNPQRGGRISVHTAPYHDVLNSHVRFWKKRVSLSSYWPVARRLIVANRVVVGMISGSANERIPADERYYAGGGGTVRGYAYQLVGPLDEQRRPLGGKSMGAVSLELRWLLTREFGLVAFTDGGAVYTDNKPGSPGDFLWGAGGGFRYYTPVGPLRFDLAFPLDRRSGVDDALQFYISLGQAF